MGSSSRDILHQCEWWSVGNKSPNDMLQSTCLLMQFTLMRHDLVIKQYEQENALPCECRVRTDRPTDSVEHWFDAHRLNLTLCAFVKYQWIWWKFSFPQWISGCSRDENRFASADRHRANQDAKWLDESERESEQVDHSCCLFTVHLFGSTTMQRSSTPLSHSSDTSTRLTSRQWHWVLKPFFNRLRKSFADIQSMCSSVPRLGVKCCAMSICIRFLLIFPVLN